LKLVAIGDNEGNISFWDSETWKCCSTKKYHDSQINAIRYSGKVNSILTASDDSKIKVCKIQAQPEEAIVLNGHKDKVWSLLVIEDYDVFYSSGKEACIIGWDLSSLVIKHKIDTRGRDTTGTEMVFIPSLNLLAVSFKQGTISFYDIETPLEVRSINTYQKWIHCMKYIPEKDELVVGVDIGTVKVWRIGENAFQPTQGLNIPGSLPLCMMPLSNHEEILIGSDYEKLVLLNVRTKNSVTSRNLDLKDVISMKVIPRNRKILVGTKRKELIILRY